jgi:hypothetical protein
LLAIHGAAVMLQNLPDTMKLACEILAPESDATIPLEMFFEIYEYLASVDGTVKPETVYGVRSHLEKEWYVSRVRPVGTKSCPNEKKFPSERMTKFRSDGSDISVSGHLMVNGPKIAAVPHPGNQSPSHGNPR